MRRRIDASLPQPKIAVHIDAFVRIMTHLNFAAGFLNVLVEQIAASYVAYQATAWTRVKATVALLTGVI